MGEELQTPQLNWASEHHLRLCFGPSLDERATVRLNSALAAIERVQLPGLIGITPASTTLLLEFELEQLVEARTVNAVRQALADASDAPPLAPAVIIKIPVCYDESLAPDATDVARIRGISHAELVRLHARAEYVVQFIGFAPGFGYLSGLPNQLNTPRLETPRTRVPAGSVGIAADQTGVYPGNTAGGWRLIGRTPLRMFDAGRVRPSLLARGDRVRFVPISLPEFHARTQGGPRDE